MNLRFWKRPPRPEPTFIVWPFDGVMGGVFRAQRTPDNRIVATLTDAFGSEVSLFDSAEMPK